MGGEGVVGFGVGGLEIRGCGVAGGFGEGGSFGVAGGVSGRIWMA